MVPYLNGMVATGLYPTLTTLYTYALQSGNNTLITSLTREGRGSPALTHWKRSENFTPEQKPLKRCGQEAARSGVSLLFRLPLTSVKGERGRRKERHSDLRSPFRAVISAEKWVTRKTESV